MGFWITFLAVFGADFLTKSWIRATLPVGETRSVIGDLLVLTHWKNTGAAFGYLRGATAFLAIISACSIAVSVFLYPKLRSLGWGVPVLLGLISGGAMGNLLDRIRERSVTDFISLSFFPPVFNIADAAIVVGTILLSVFFLFSEKGRGV